MKKINRDTLKKQTLPFFVLIILGLLIWYGGPLVHISDDLSFSSPLKRAYIISVFFLAWILKVILIDGIEEPRKLYIAPDTQKQLARLQGRFKGALAFLQKTFIDKSGKKIHLARLPWLLMIGPPGSGKTTLLAEANIPFILAKQFKPGVIKEVLPSDQCDWWVTRDWVLVDIPGRFLPSKKHQQKTVAQPQWRYFLDLMRKFHIDPFLQGMVMVLNLPELCKKDQWAKSDTIYDLKRRMTEFYHRFGKLRPVYFVITKCDLLLGFNEFFSDSTTDEMSQTWGVTLPLNENENVADVFAHRFNTLIKRLNKQLIFRLHHERNPNARPYIKEFPLQLEQLKEAIVQFIKILMIPQLPLRGVYLTSSTQIRTEESRVHDPESLQALQIVSPPQPSRVYFTRQLLLNHFLAKPPSSLEPKQMVRRWERRIVYAASISTVVVASLFLGRDFQHSVERAYAIRNVLSQYELTTQNKDEIGDKRIIDVLPLLDTLKQVARSEGGSWTLTYYSRKAEQTAKVIYQKALKEIVVPEIRRYFEDYLSKADNKNPEQIYAVLKAYLMLSDTRYFEAGYISNILQPWVPETVSHEALLELMSHIHSTFSTTQPLALNSNLIAGVRGQLNSLPNSVLGFVLLKNMENNSVDSVISLGTHFGDPPVFTSNALAAQIPTVFTAKVFQKMTTEEVNIAAEEVLNGNWVLGEKGVIADASAIRSLAAELRTEYVAKYVDIWESLLDNLTLTKPKNLMQVAAMVATLTGDHSPLIQVLDTIKQNTTFAPITTASVKLQNLSTLLLSADNSSTSTLYQVFVSLKELDAFLRPIVDSSEVGSAAFLASAKRMQNSLNDPISRIRDIAEQTPEPLKNWLNDLANETWRCMLQDTAQLIESAWENNVMVNYHASIANRYPFSQKATREVNLQQFIQFLGQQGQLALFYQTYLRPFIQNDRGLQWRVVEHQALPFSTRILERIQHAQQIQRVFFPNNDNKLYVSFTLQPIALESKVQNFTLNINGQAIRYQKNKNNMDRVIAWPGLNTLHATTLHFMSPPNQWVGSRFDGDWGWFKLVVEATKKVRSRNEIELAFNVQGRTAKYLLLTQGRFNPFIPLNLEGFSLPERLSRG